MQDQTQSFRSAREWLSVLARYREPSTRRSLFELAATLVPFLALWALAWMALQVSPWLALALAVLNGAFLVRIFIIQHDCGHGSFLANRKAQDWVGRVLGVLTLTPMPSGGAPIRFTTPITATSTSAALATSPP